MSVIGEIKERIDIVELVSDYVSLQKAGRNFRALCPFHVEKHPSFLVFPETQSWRCFGACNTGGDVFSFLMKKEGIDFGQALRFLAERAGIPLALQKDQGEVKQGEEARLFEINEVAAEYYHRLLLTAPEADFARKYIIERGLVPQTVKNFQIGFSSDSWEALSQYLTGKGYSFEELVAAGLVIEKEAGGGYDRFRNRLMFPIRDIQGRLTGFGARALDDSIPKYLNSPQTPIFDKGSIVYGIDRARTAIRQRNSAVIVEGYMDVLITHQYGWENVVASMGTSLTEKQLGILKRLTKNLFLALDADVAGEEAVLRSIETIGQTLDKKVVPVPIWSGLIRYENMLDADVRVIMLPSGKDPDEVIKEDISLWQDLVDKALPVVDFAVHTIISRVDLEQPRDKSLAWARLKPLISEIKDPIRQSHYLQKLARLLRADERVLAGDLRRSHIKKRRSRIDEEGEESLPCISSLPLSSALEEYCLALLLRYPEFTAIKEEVRPEYFQHMENRELFIKWHQSAELSSFRDSLDPPLQEYADQLLSRTLPTSVSQSEEERWHALTDCVLRLQERWLRNLEAEREEALLLEAERSGMAAQLLKLEEEGIDVSRRLKEIFSKRDAGTRQRRGRG